MITIRNNELKSTKVVTKGAYDGTYKSLGYEVVRDYSKPLKKEVEEKNDNKEEVVENQDDNDETENKDGLKKYSRK